jgi:hypothetical protein
VRTGIISLEWEKQVKFEWEKGLFY